MGSDESPKKDTNQKTFINQQNTVPNEVQNTKIVNNNIIKKDISEKEYINRNEDTSNENYLQKDYRDYSNGKKDYSYSEKKDKENSVSTRNYTCTYNEMDLINKLKESLENYSIQESIYKLEQSNDDPIFNKINVKLSQILFEYLKKNKNNFLNSISNFINLKPLNVGTNIVSDLIQTENGYSIYEKKVMKEIAKINDNKSLFKINYLSVILIGKSGVGKSALVNCLLKLKKGEQAKENTGDIGTVEIKGYQSDEVPFLRLIDTRGIELNYKYGAAEITEECKNYIQSQLHNNDMNKFIHCIWYCLTGTRFEKVEIDALNILKKSYVFSNIPIIVVYTQSTDTDLVKKTREYVNEKSIANDYIEVLAREKSLHDGHVLKSFGLDTLLEKTIKVCKEALNGDMHLIMTKKIDEHISNNLKIENSNIKKYINEKNILDFTKEYNIISKNEFQNYLINIYGKNVNCFLDKDLSNEGKNIIKTSHLINSHNNEYIINYSNKLKEIISKDLHSLSVEGLNFQAMIEKQNQRNTLIENKRDLEDFKIYIRKFFSDNLSNLAQKYYISYILQNTSKYFSNSFEQKCNDIVNEILNHPKIKKKISHLFQQRFKEFEVKILDKRLISKTTEIDEDKIYNDLVKGNLDIDRRRDIKDDNNLQKNDNIYKEKDIMMLNFDKKPIYDIRSRNTDKISNYKGSEYSNSNNYKMIYNQLNTSKRFSDTQTYSTINLKSNKNLNSDLKNNNVDYNQNNLNNNTNNPNPYYYINNFIPKVKYYVQTSNNLNNSNIYNSQNMNPAIQGNIHTNKKHYVLKSNNNNIYQSQNMNHTNYVKKSNNSNVYNFQNMNHANQSNIHCAKTCMKNNNPSNFQNMNLI